jgi:hypothetical protein
MSFLWFIGPRIEGQLDLDPQDEAEVYISYGRRDQARASVATGSAGGWLSRHEKRVAETACYIFRRKYNGRKKCNIDKFNYFSVQSAGNLFFIDADCA